MHPKSFFVKIFFSNAGWRGKRGILIGKTGKHLSFKTASQVLEPTANIWGLFLDLLLSECTGRLLGVIAGHGTQNSPAELLRLGIALLLPFAGTFGVLNGSAGMDAGLAVGTALAFLVSPPRSSALGRMRWLLLALALAPCLALLPLWIGGTPWWREILSYHYPEASAHTISPLPGLILQSYPRHLTFLAWIWWVCGHSREWQTRLLHGMGIGIAAVLSLGLCNLQWVSGFWDGPHRELLDHLAGTRNQAAGVASITLVASAAMAISLKNLTWLLGTLPAIAALLLLGSRGAAASALLGIFVAVALLVSSNRNRSFHRLLPAALTAAVGIVLIGMFLPSHTLMPRVLDNPVGGIRERLAVQMDAWGMVASYPLSGSGRGSFVVVFPFHQNFSLQSDQPTQNWHPESDWLWTAAELGLPAGILAATLVVWMASRWVLPRWQPSCVTALAVGSTVIAQGLVDVPLHAPLPFLLAALFLCRSPGTTGPPRRNSSLVAAMVLFLLAFLALAKPAKQFTVFESFPTAVQVSWQHPLDPQALETLAILLLRNGDERGWRILRASLLLRPHDREAPARAARLARDLDRSDLVHEFETMALPFQNR